MAVTNIELYEALKRDLNEDAARMIAEVVPPAANVATKSDIAELKAELKTDMARLEARMSDFEARLARNMNRWGAFFVIPLWGAVVAAGVKFFFGT